MSRLHHWLTFSPPLCLCSGSTGLEEEKALWEAAGSDRRYVVHHRVPEGGARERQHQHGSAQEHGLRCKGNEGCARKHVRDVEERVRLFCRSWGSCRSFLEFIFICVHTCSCPLSVASCVLQGHRQSWRSDGGNHRTTGSGSRNLRCNFQTGRFWRGLRRGENAASVLGVLMDPGTIRGNVKR